MGSGTSSATAKARERARSFGAFLERYTPDYDEDGRYTDVPVEMTEKLREQGLNSTTTFQLWLEDADDYGKPEVVSSDEFDKLVESGTVSEIYRGMPDSARTTGEKKLNQMLYEDKYYAGNGMYGDGLYFAVRPDVGASYAAGDQFNGYKGTGSVARAALKPGSRVITYDEALRQSDKEYPNRFISYGDISAWARSKGYDAIRVDHPQNGVYYNVINRSALVVSDKLGRAKVTKNWESVDVKW